MKNKVWLLFLSSFYMMSLEAGRFATSSTINAVKTAATGLSLSAAQDISTTNSDNSFANRSSSPSRLHLLAEDMDQDSDEQKSRGFFDNLSKLKKFGMGIALLCLVSGGAMAAWKLNGWLSEGKATEFLNGFKDNTVKDFRSGLEASSEEDKRSITAGTSEAAKLGLRLQKIEHGVEHFNSMAPKINTLLENINSKQALIETTLTNVNGMAPEVQAMLPEIKKAVAEVVLLKNSLAGFVEGLGVHPTQLKRQNEYDSKKVMNALGQCVANAGPGLVGQRFIAPPDALKQKRGL